MNIIVLLLLILSTFVFANGFQNNIISKDYDLKYGEYMDDLEGATSEEISNDDNDEEIFGSFRFPTPKPVTPAPTHDGNVRFGDRIVISAGSSAHKTGNCGWYGCRVAEMLDDRKMYFSHGGIKPYNFYIRPKVGSGKKTGDIVTTNDQVVIAQTSNSGNTGCGWYGCRVAQWSIFLSLFNHGGSNPKTINLNNGYSQNVRYNNKYRLKYGSNLYYFMNSDRYLQFTGQNNHWFYIQQPPTVLRHYLKITSWTLLEEQDAWLDDTEVFFKVYYTDEYGKKIHVGNSGVTSVGNNHAGWFDYEDNTSPPYKWHFPAYTNTQQYIYTSVGFCPEWEVQMWDEDDDWLSGSDDHILTTKVKISNCQSGQTQSKKGENDGAEVTIQAIVNSST